MRNTELLNSTQELHRLSQLTDNIGHPIEQQLQDKCVLGVFVGVRVCLHLATFFSLFSSEGLSLDWIAHTTLHHFLPVFSNPAISL